MPGYKDVESQVISEKMRAVLAEMMPKCDGDQKQREHDAALVRAMIDMSPWNEKPWARMALAIAARAITRGRHLTADEQLANLARALEEEG